MISAREDPGRRAGSGIRRARARHDRCRRRSATTLDVTLIDKSDAFVFGYSKLDVMFGRTTLDAVRLPYRGAREARRALPAGDDHRDRARPAARHDRRRRPRGRLPRRRARRRLRPRRDARARRGRQRVLLRGGRRRAGRACFPSFSGGRAIVGVCGAPFKCPPAPSEAALLLHDYLVARGVRDACEITLVIPFPTPVPPSPDTSRGARSPRSPSADIEFVAGRRVASLDAAARRRRARRRRRAAVRPLPRRAEAPRARRRDRERHDRGRLRARRLADARDALPRRVRGRRRGDGRRAEGRRVRRGRRARRRRRR